MNLKSLEQKQEITAIRSSCQETVKHRAEKKIEIAATRREF